MVREMGEEKDEGRPRVPPDGYDADGYPLGEEDEAVCPRCLGSGSVTSRGMIPHVYTCSRCKGSGSVVLED